MYIKQLSEDLKKFADKLHSNSRKLMKDIGYMFLSNTETKWEHRGEGQWYQGEKWPPLEESTVKARQGRRTPMLEDTGDMHTALDVESDEDSALIYFKRPEDEKYKRHHQGNANLPQRKVLDITPEDEQDIEEMVDDFIGDILRGL